MPALLGLALGGCREPWPTSEAAPEAAVARVGLLAVAGRSADPAAVLPDVGRLSSNEPRTLLLGGASELLPPWCWWEALPCMSAAVACEERAAPSAPWGRLLRVLLRE
jgi:hypothetical protein